MHPSRRQPRRRTYVASFVALMTVSFAAAAHADWPQFRGPERNGSAAPQQILQSWPDDGPRELWRRSFGAGFSSVASVGDRLYTQGAEDDKEYVFCLDAKTGKTLWKTPLGTRFEGQFGDGPRATPNVDGDTVFAVSSDLQLAALAIADGKPKWLRDLQKDFGAQRPRFGYSPSPLIDGDVMLLEVGGTDDTAVVAFDKKTGEVRWNALEGFAGSSSPIVVELGGKKQYVFNRLAGFATIGVTPEGEVLWSHPCGEDTIVMPQFLPPDRFFVSSATRGKGGILFRVTAKDGEFTTEELWTNKRFRTHFNNAVVVGPHLYGFDNSTLRCVDAETGETQWSERGFGKGSLIACGENLVILGDQGTLALALASPDEYLELGRVQAMEGRSWTSPTLASGRIIVRDLDEMVAYDVRATGDSGRVTARPDTAGETGTGTVASADLELDAILAGYAKARGGLDAWRAIESLELRGTFSAFSESGDFHMVRHRPDLYRFEYTALGNPDKRGRDREGAWWVYHLFQITIPSRVAMPQYKVQLEREAMFEPPLLAPAEHGIEVAKIGAGNVDGTPTLDLEVTYPNGSTETWMLDARTFLEVAIDQQIADFSQAREPMNQRTFFSDFRRIDGGIVIPFQRNMEFGARLEEIVVSEANANPEGVTPPSLDMPAVPTEDDSSGKSDDNGDEDGGEGDDEDGRDD